MITTTKPILQAFALSCVRNEHVLFSDLSFDLYGGDLLQIGGANGSGKTSLLRILCGLTPAAMGEIHWHNTPIQTARELYYTELLYIGHQTGIKNWLTAKENIVLATALGRIGNQTMNDLEQILTEVSLAKQQNVLAHQLSTGQKRRLAIARLILQPARLWILDEPFTALDHAGTTLLRTLIDAHVSKGGMVILTTHQHVEFNQGRVRKLYL